MSHSGTTLGGVACGSFSKSASAVARRAPHEPLDPSTQRPLGDIIVDCLGLAPAKPDMPMNFTNGRSCRDPCYRMGHPLGRQLPPRFIYLQKSIQVTRGFGIGRGEWVGVWGVVRVFGVRGVVAWGGWLV